MTYKERIEKRKEMQKFKRENKIDGKIYSLNNMLPKKYRHYKKKVIGDKVILTEK